MDYLQYLASFQRQQHLHSDAYMDILYGNQIKIMHKLNMPLHKQSFPFKTKITKEGYLIDDKGKRCKPFNEAEEKTAINVEDSDNDDEEVDSDE